MYPDHVIDRFERRYQWSEDCWLWLGAKTKQGYGQFMIQYKNLSAHVVSYQIYKGQISEGLVVDHTCENTSCVNPEHLELVTKAENARRYSERRTHCSKGHRLHEGNVTRSSGYKQCRQCKNDTQRRYKNK